MDHLQLLALAVLQGVTEFLPISSSGHLALFPHLFGMPDQGLGFDVAVHVGTLVAVVSYFRRDIGQLSRAWLSSLHGARTPSPESRLAWCVLVATLPVAVAGLLLSDVVEGALRDPRVIAAATLGFGLVMWWADARGAKTRSIEEVGWRDVAVIGGAQVLALIPGTSRSGITITAGMGMGLTRTSAARFSFLLSIPVIALAGGWQALELVSRDLAQWHILLAGAVLAGTCAFACIHWFLKMLERYSLLPFVLYRLALGLWLLYLYR